MNLKKRRQEELNWYLAGEKSKEVRLVIRSIFGHVEKVDKKFIQKVKEDLCEEYFNRPQTMSYNLDRIPQTQILEKIDKHSGYNDASGEKDE